MNVSPNEGGDVVVGGFGIQTEASKKYGGCSPVGQTSLEALPAKGYKFDQWSGALYGSLNPASILVDISKTVTVNFKALPDVDNDGFANDEDCDDHDAKTHPGATEICGDGKDNDCDNTIDDGCPITPPSSLTIKAKASTQIVLGWKDNSKIEDGYKIEQKAGGCSSKESWKTIGTKPANTTEYTVSKLTPNTFYSFRVKAHKSYSHYSEYSNCAAAKTGASGTPPSPTNLKATSISPNKVNVTWNDNSANETGFKVYGKAGAGVWTLLKTTGPNVKIFSDINAANNSSSTIYQYYIFAFNKSGNSPSTYAAATPYQPINLKVTQGTTAGSIILSWTDKSNNETGFEIERKSSNCASTAKWTKVATLGPNTKTWTDKWLNSGIKYAYRIRAYRQTGAILSAYGYSMYSNCSTVTTP